MIEINVKQLILSENGSTHITPGYNHRLLNPGKILLELIEVRICFYLGEDDIVRLQDNYGAEKDIFKNFENIFLHITRIL
mgnify:CR=1 FL=1